MKKRIRDLSESEKKSLGCKGFASTNIVFGVGLK